MSDETVSVFCIAPFWRYAVGPMNRRNPALPFYRYASAKAFAETMRRDLPWEPAVIYRRKWWRGIVAVEVLPRARKEAAP